MSESNYGDKDLQIRIPIEIVPDIKDIQKGIKKIQRDAKYPSEFRGGQVQAKLIGTALVPRGGNAPFVKSPEDYKKDKEQRSIDNNKLVQGIAPTEFRLGYIQPKLKGTASVPLGGKAPQDMLVKKKPTDPKTDELDADGIFVKALGGPAKARQALNFLSNPGAGLVKLLNALGGAGAGVAVGGGMALAHIALWVAKEFTKKGGLADKTFRNIIDTRVEIMRTREQQQKYLVGFGDDAQLITTTSAGTTNPRDTFNTYTEYNKDELEHESKWAIRTSAGYP